VGSTGSVSRGRLVAPDVTPITSRRSESSRMRLPVESRRLQAESRADANDEVPHVP
jgi:hypothetical protein